MCMFLSLKLNYAIDWTQVKDHKDLLCEIKL